MSGLSIMHVLAPAAHGGLETVVCALAAGQRARDHLISIAAVVDGKTLDHPFLSAAMRTGAKVYPLDLHRRAYMAERRAMARLFASIKPHVVHTHGYRPDVVDAGVARRMGLPTVTTVHGFTGGERPNRIYEFLQIRAFRKFDAVVAVSQPLSDLLRRRGVPAHRLHTILNAWHPQVAPLPRAEARRILGVPAHGQRLGFVGRLSREKGPDLLLAAAALIDPRVELSFVGDGRERRALEAHAGRLRIESRVTWHGALRDAARLVTAFDVLVLSSRTEGTPLVLFEAMAAGVPIVAAAVGGVPDIVSSREAMLVKPGDASALAQSVTLVLSDATSAANRVAAAQQRLRDEFQPGPWFDAYERLYRALAETGHTIT